DDCTTIWHRVSKFTPTIKLQTGKELDVGTDGTGMRMANGGVYREFKYGKKKGRKKYVVVTITADVKRRNYSTLTCISKVKVTQKRGLR
ncbi:MAG: hypothetical protein QXP36_13955, partial [Conexivisphaerales archaeon]